MHKALWAYWFHRLWRASWVGVLVAAACALPGSIYPGDQRAFVVISLHSIWLGICLGRVGGSEAEFLYSRGYSRGRIWWHGQAMAGLAALAVCLVPLLLEWIGLREWVRIELLHRSRGGDGATLVWGVATWLVFYGLMVPLCSLAAVRRDGGEGGGLLAAGVGIAGVVMLHGVTMLAGGSGWIALAAAIAMALLGVFATWRVQAEMEVGHGS